MSLRYSGHLSRLKSFIVEMTLASEIFVATSFTFWFRLVCETGEAWVAAQQSAQPRSMHTTGDAPVRT